MFQQFFSYSLSVLLKLDCFFCYSLLSFSIHFQFMTKMKSLAEKYHMQKDILQVHLNYGGRLPFEYKDLQGSLFY